MARIPSPYELSGPGSLRPSGQLAVVDNSGLARGLSDLGQGIDQATNSILQYQQEQKRRQNVADVAKAEAMWTRASLDIGNKFSEDGDYATFNERSALAIEEAKQAAAELIRDDRMRENWMADVELKGIALADSINDRGRALSNQADQVALETAISDSARMISEPSVPEATREKARADIQGTIQRAVGSGLITPATGYEYTKKYLDGAEGQLAWNRARLDILGNPLGVQTSLGISPAMGSGDVASAAAAVNGGLVPLDVGLAGLAAKALDDRAFPQDPKLAEAYLKDPDINAKYAHAAMGLLTQRYKGDMTAAVIASAPGGGSDLADAWVKSGHDESVLPPKVRNYYLDVMGKFAPAQSAVTLPVVAQPGVSIENVDVAVLDRFEKMQSAFGKTLPIKAGYIEGSDSFAASRRSLTLDTSGLSKEEVLQAIATASAMGFTGIGVGKDSLQIDTGARRVIGDAPAWAKDALAQAVAGEFAAPVAGIKGVDPKYAALTFDQRLSLYAQAKAASDQQAMNLKAGIAVAVDNAPVAVARSGGYDGVIPTAEDFVHAFGAAEGIRQFKAFDAQMQVAETSYGMRTMSAEDIMAAVAQAAPTSTGDQAAVEQARYETLMAAAQGVLKAREADPAGYAINAFPNVAEAWQAVEGDPSKYPDALAVTAEAQASLGITSPALLPTGMASAAAATFNNAEMPQDARVGAVAYLVMGARDEGQQKAIFDQLVKAGVPPTAHAAMDALVRGDTGAAHYLFRAAMLDPQKLPLDANRFRPVDIQSAIAGAIEENTIADVMYGITDGTATNMQRIGTDMALIESAVRLRLIDGSATTPDQAVDMTIRDMFGDVRVVRDRNVKITLPSNEDARPMLDGFNALLGEVGSALHAQMTPALAGVATSNGEAQVLGAARDMYVEQALADGYFTNAGPGSFVYVDPATGAYVPAADGTPLIFSAEDVLQAGAVAGALAPPPTSGRGYILGDPMGVP